MITDQDVEKLKGTFVTKENLREELRAYATQESLDQLSTKVDGIQEELADLKVEVGEIHDSLGFMEGKIDSLDTKFDAMLGLLTDSMQEHGAGAVHLARHDRQIGALAAAVSIQLPD